MTAATAADWAPYFASGIALVAAIATGYFGWRTKGLETSAPDKLADGFTSLVADLRAEIIRLNERVDILERQRREDLRHIASMELQIDWLVKHVDAAVKDEFEALFRPFK